MATKLLFEDITPNKQNVLNINRSRMRAIYYRPIKTDTGGVQWVQTSPLPADPYSITYYFTKGFKAKPPDVVVDKEADTTGGVKCPLCDFKAKDAFGLQSHLRKHVNEERKEEIPK